MQSRHHALDQTVTDCCRVSREHHLMQRHSGMEQRQTSSVTNTWESERTRPNAAQARAAQHHNPTCEQSRGSTELRAVRFVVRFSILRFIIASINASNFPSCYTTNLLQQSPTTLPLARERQTIPASFGRALEQPPGSWVGW